MASDIPLPDDLIAELREHPRAFAAVQLLTARGPLMDVDAAFSRDTADLAYFLWLMFYAARRPKGMLDGRPRWEAAATFASRVRSASPCGRDLAGFGHALMKRLNLRPESALAEADLLWWRGLCANDEPSGLWRRLRRPEALADVIVAFGLLDTWMYSLSDDAQKKRDNPAPEATR